MRRSVASLFVAASTTLAASAQEKKEPADFNFDGHPDYRVLAEEDGKADRYALHLFDPQTKTVRKYPELFVNPETDPKSKEIRCLHPGGHSGAIFYREDYSWKDGKLVLARIVRQSAISRGGDLIYVRVVCSIAEGKPRIESIEQVDPWK